MNVYVLLLFGGVLITVGIVRIIRSSYLTKHGTITNGVIHDFISVPNDRGGMTFYPIVRFSVDNDIVTKKYTIGFSFKLYRKGSNVRVIYDPVDSSNFIIDTPFVRVLFYVFVITGATLCGISIFKIFN
jgi:Protein of unknown function (DUF3592)